MLRERPALKINDFQIESSIFSGTRGIKISDNSFKRIILKNSIFSKEQQHLQFLSQVITEHKKIENISITIQSTTFIDCFSEEKGGAIDFFDCNTIHMKDSAITESRAEYGAALHAEKAKILMSDCNFSKNTAHISCGAILLKTTPIVSKHCILNENIARESVGALQLDDAATICETTHFLNNKAKCICAAIFVNQKSSLLIKGSEFIDNRCSSTKCGGAMYINNNDMPVTVMNCVFIRNECNFGESTNVYCNASTSIVSFINCFADQALGSFIKKENNEMIIDIQGFEFMLGIGVNKKIECVMCNYTSEQDPEIAFIDAFEGISIRNVSLLILVIPLAIILCLLVLNKC